MHRICALTLLVLAGSAAFCQTNDKPASSASVLKQFSSSARPANCPIQLNASFYVVGKPTELQPVENGRTTERDQRIYITLANPASQIASVQLTVYGFPVGVRIDPAVAYVDRDNRALVHDPAEIHKTIAIDRAIGAGQSTSMDVSIRDFSIVSSVDLNSVTYSDGSSWHAADHKYCQAVGSSNGPLLVDNAVTRRLALRRTKPQTAKAAVFP